MRTPNLFALFVLTSALAPAAGAQLASSAGYQLDGFDLDGAGGMLCSIGYASAGALDPFGAAGLSSASFQAELGFLGAFDSGPTLLPVVFGVVPSFGPSEGGTSVTLAGLNFDKLGAAAPVTVDVGGVPATSVVVGSDTQLTLTTPVGTPGPNDVAVSSSFGTGTLAGGFVHTPAVTSAPSALLGGPLELRNYGPLGGIYQIYFSPFQTSIPLPPYGILLIGPTNVFTLSPLTVYPAPNGISDFVLPLPPDPTLQGATIHFQDLAVVSVSPLDVRFTNRTSVLLL